MENNSNSKQVDKNTSEQCKAVEGRPETNKLTTIEQCSAKQQSNNPQASVKCHGINGKTVHLCSVGKACFSENCYNIQKKQDKGGKQ